MTARRAVPLIGIIFCVGVIVTLMQTGVPLSVILPAILLLGALALVLLISVIAGQANR
jgi:hypothetical protein